MGPSRQYFSVQRMSCESESERTAIKIKVKVNPIWMAILKDVDAGLPCKSFLSHENLLDYLKRCACDAAAAGS